MGVKYMKNFKLDVLGLGTCNIDYLMNVSRFSNADDEVDIEDLRISLGGSAANFTIEASRLGLNTGIMARIGKDNYGDYIRSEFERERICTDRLLAINEKTGMAFIAVEPEGERSIYTFMGANSKFRLENEDIKYIKNSEMLHMTGMYIEVVEEASKYANTLSFNPGALLASYGMEALEKIIKRTDILFLNQKEVKILTNMEYNEGARLLVDTGVPLVVVTMGNRGAKVYTESNEINYSANKLNVVDTTGAGDSFAAGFITAFYQKKELDKCLMEGNRSASNCVSRLGSLNGLEYNQI
jgi:sugar/nucleoside kinase (ribokinase family)